MDHRPDSFFTLEQETPDQIGSRKIFMTGDSNQRAFEPPSHVLDEARFATASQSLKYYSQPRRVTTVDR